MKIYDRNSESVIAHIITNHSMTLDEAIALVGEYSNDRASECLEDVCIDGEWYNYDMLEIGADEDFERKAVATIDTDKGRMTIYYNGAHELMTAEIDGDVEEIEDSLPGTYADAVQTIAWLYVDPVWELEWIGADEEA